MGRPARMRDIAALAGVSVATVSRVVNDKPVDPLLRARVKQAIVKLGYRPNHTARSLRRGQDNMIGVVVDDLANPFIGSVLTAIEQVARERGVFMLAVSAGPGLDAAVVRALVDRQIAGLVLIPSDPDQSYLRSVSASIPVVLVDRLYRGAAELKVDAVTVDNVAGGRMAAEELLRQGHRDVVFIGCERGLPTVGDRYRGFVAALADAGVSLPQDRTIWVGRNPGTATVAEAVARTLAGRPLPTAMFASAARTTDGLIHSWHRLGCPPMGLIGFDDTTLSRLPWRPLTVVNQDPHAIGRLATEILFDRQADPQAPPVRHRLPLELIDRGSARMVTDPPGVEVPGIALSGGSLPALTSLPEAKGMAMGATLGSMGRWAPPHQRQDRPGEGQL